jgi:hypothetical protein
MTAAADQVGPRPSREDVELALARARQFAVEAARDDEFEADIEPVLRAALAPRPEWPAREVGLALGVDPANLGDVRGLPEPAQLLPRPTVVHPDKVMRLWYADEIVAFAPEWRARKTRRNDGDHADTR